MTLSTLITISLLGLVFLPSTASAEDESRPYPVDVTAQTLADSVEFARLHEAGRILFDESFDGPDALRRFFNLRGKDRGALEVISDSSVAHTGDGCLQLHTVDNQGKSSGTSASYWLSEGVDTLYFRRYIRFAEDYDQGNLHHVGGSLAAVSGDDPSGGMGHAGQRPSGDDRFTAGFEPWRAWGQNEAPGVMSLYTYWMDMKVSRDGEHYYGNQFIPENGVVLKRGVWHCLEHALISNTPGEADGEMAAWIDGELYIHLKGFRWRSSPDVKPRRIALGMYIHKSTRRNVLWHDDVALSTGYIGPLRND